MIAENTLYQKTLLKLVETQENNVFKHTVAEATSEKTDWQTKLKLYKNVGQDATDWMNPDYQNHTESSNKLNKLRFKRKQFLNKHFTCNISIVITFLSCWFATPSPFLFWQLTVCFHSIIHTQQTDLLHLSVPHVYG